MYENKKGQTKVCPFFLKMNLKFLLLIIFVSTILLISTFSFDIVPPILNRGIQPATFPKALLVLIISLTLIVYFLSTKKPWKSEKKLPKPFYLTLISFIIYFDFKNFRFLFSNFCFICFCFILLG